MKKFIQLKQINFIFKSFLTLPMLILYSALTMANSNKLGWNSSGGETIKDRRNPWFFSNTKTIKYCLLIDEELFGQKLKQVKPRVEKSINMWKKQLKDLQYRQELGLESNSFLLGTQDFIETTCQFENGDIKKSDADLVFQFGVLSNEQLHHLKNPSQFLGLTIRTDYDKVKLKGSGFIYFSPEKGPLSFNKLGLIQNPWSSAQGALLTPALLHELGHVFGIQHSTTFSLMNETFIENLMIAQNFKYQEKWLIQMEQEEVWQQYRFFKWEPNLWIQNFLECDTHNYSWDRTNKIFYQFLGINSSNKNPETELCFFMNKNSNGYNFTAYLGQQIVGTAKLERFDVTDDTEPLIDIWLPKEQKVFITDYIINNQLETVMNIASFQSEALFKGNYIVKSTGESRPFNLTAYHLRGKYRFGGLLNGIYYMDLKNSF